MVELLKAFQDNAVINPDIVDSEHAFSPHFSFSPSESLKIKQCKWPIEWGLGELKDQEGDDDYDDLKKEKKKPVKRPRDNENFWT